MTDAALTALLRRSNCWFSVDHVPGDVASTAWKRAARLAQAQWRERHGHPIGAEPHVGGPQSTPVGSRLALAFAKSSGANFINAAARLAAETRLKTPEPHQMLAADRLWADLLSSMPMCFNLFGDLAADAERAGTAVHAWWPDAPVGAVTVRFEHSPGRLDPLFLGNRSAFDVAFDIDVGQTRAIVGVETKYHEHAKAEGAPKAKALARYVEVTERSRAFADDWRKRLVGTDLQQIWLDHLLVLAMLQHPSKRWTWGRFVLVHPSKNPSFIRAAKEYRAALREPSTFASITIEDLVATPGALDSTTVAELRKRYLEP